MRKVIYGLNLTADGCCDHTKGNPGKEIHVYFTELLQQADLIIYGRKTYELMVPYWPEVAKNLSGTASENDFARTFSAIDRLVFSRTLESADERTRIVRSGLQEEIHRLKQQPGKNISIGGVDLPEQLIALGLVDEFHFVVHPVLAGAGRRLLAGTDLQAQLNLKLADAKTLSSGHVALHYLKQ